MSTLTPAWRQTADDECIFTHNSITAAAENHQANIRRRISSSLNTWEKQTCQNSDSQSSSGNGSANKTEETYTESTALTQSACTEDDSSNFIQQQNNETADVEHELQLARDTVQKYHYQRAENSDSTGNVTDSNILSRRHSRISMIIIYGREALCILALILTTYASIQNSKPRISKAPPPVPFFSRGSLVHDWPSGALGPTQTRVSQSELSFVFYYAPWCAESQHARFVYEHVARLYYREAHFAAINCWQPGGECRLQYSKVQSWPVLMAYQPNGLAVQYHQAWTNAALVRFVQSLITPIQRLAGPGDLMRFMTGKDAVVVAFLDMKANSKQYSRLYQTSLKWLEKDPFQEVAFGVVTGESANAFGVEETPAARLYLWNETIEFTGNESWTQPELVDWISKHIQVVSMWIAPPGATKSASLAPYFKHGPVLFYFTPRTLYDATSPSDAYMLLRQLGMQYYNCKGDIWVEEMAKRYIAEQRRVNAETYVQLKKNCVVMLKNNPSQSKEQDEGRRNACTASSTVAVSFVNVLNSSKFTEGRQKIRSLGGGPHGYCEIEPVKCDERFYECGVTEEEESLNFESNDNCPRKKQKHSSLYGSVNTNYPAKKQSISLLDAEQDYRGSQMLRKLYLRKQCELLQLSETDHEEIFFSEPADQGGNYVDLIQGLACKFNKTLTFLGMDSALYHAFAERLGVDVLTEPNMSVAIIVDHEDESTYLLKGAISLASMSKFVYDFYNRTYPRFLRANNISFKNTHSFNMSEFRKENRRIMQIKRKETLSQENRADNERNVSQGTTGKKSQEATSGPQAQNQPHHYIREINSRNFQQAVINTNKTVIAHFYSTQCAFCSMLSQHLLSVSRMLRQQPRLEFVRIDGDKNDLQWEYSMDAFPTLIIFPNQRKSESRIFARHLQLTVPNVLGFILANLTPPERIHANYLICDSVKWSPSRDECLLAIKRELSDSISLNLRLYRKSTNRPARAAQVLRRLQALQEFYLATLGCFSHSCDFTRLKTNAETILTMWQMTV
ncbi:thioredoxin domain-containing protein 11 [Wyeomyia smithii]|uniref:thioredoxin domain-containing protein 11 n=1 Tax=Wyeomyia smithii TaxID=174621 RepID=UPI002467E6E7|nr:thioredoxin domain-containing protein 11 [Wyeomyia smithii]